MPVVNQAFSSSLPPIEVRSVDHPPVRPVVAFSGRQASGYYDPPHVHDRAQFSYRLEGLAIIKVGQRSALLPPGQGVWVPAGIVHEVACQGPAAYHALYVTSAAVPQPDTVRIIEITPLLHALVQAFLAVTLTDPINGRDDLIARLILEEIVRAPDIGLGMLVMPQSPRLRMVCQVLHRDPLNTATLDDWASQVGMSRRTFTRAFRNETWMSFEEWRQHLRMSQAAMWIDQGLSVKEAAYRLGYAGTGSFMRAFARTFGHPPGSIRLKATLREGPGSASKGAVI